MQILEKCECSTLILILDDLEVSRRVGDALLQLSAVKWVTRVLWVTKLVGDGVNEIFSTHWLYAMMNTMMLSWREDNVERLETRLSG